VDIARYFLAFTQNESCGKCVPGRLGTKRMLEILTRITEGKGIEGDIELLTELAEGIEDSALCAMGQAAPNPVLTTIKYFRDEYEAHIRQKRCPAAVCEALV
jgi:NADP-reducing hydrogenase subunit HndC